MRIFLSLFGCGVLAFFSVAGKDRWMASVSAYGGLPVLKAITEPDNFYLKNYDAGTTFNLGGYYRANTGWQFGLLGSVNVLFTNRSKTEASIIQLYSRPEFLHKVSIGGDPGVLSLMAEVGKVFETGRWRITPFLRSSIVYICPASSDNNFYLKEKVPNEHYYKETYWEFSDTSLQVKFAPLQLSGGLRFGYQLGEQYEIYAAAQYQLGSIRLEGEQRQLDFYGVNSSARAFRMQQQYSLLGLEIGLHILIPGLK